jgi:hypothetical protein
LLHPGRARVSRTAPHAILLIRQVARAFDQPLSFDTSQVVDMTVMFAV